MGFLFHAECSEKGGKYAHLGYNGSLTAISGHHGQHQGQQQQQQAQLAHQVDAKSSPGNNNAADGLNSACKWGRVGSHYLYGAASVEAANGEVSWPHHHVTHHQYHPYPYHHYHNHHHQVHHHQTHQ